MPWVGRVDQVIFDCGPVRARCLVGGCDEANDGSDYGLLACVDATVFDLRLQRYGGHEKAGQWPADRPPGGGALTGLVTDAGTLVRSRPCRLIAASPPTAVDTG
jgi:hypothetical protein